MASLCLCSAANHQTLAVSSCLELAQPRQDRRPLREPAHHRVNPTAAITIHRSSQCAQYAYLLGRYASAND